MAIFREITKVENMNDVQHLIIRAFYEQKDIFSEEAIFQKIKDKLIKLDAENITRTFKFLYMVKDTLDYMIESEDFVQVSYGKYQYNYDKKREILYCFP